MANVKIIKVKQIDENDNVSRIKKRVCGYARVSTDSDDQITSYKSQIEHYTNLIMANTDWIFVGMYADDGISGTQVKNRIEFQRMIDDALNNKIDMIISKSISRFARNTMDTLKYVRLLREHNVDVYFEKENIHTLELDSEMFLTLYSAFAQAESESTSQNVKMGLRAKMKKGGYCGQANPFGFNWNKEEKKLEINEKEAEVVKIIFELYEQGLGCKKIAINLNSLGYKPRVASTWDSKKVLRVIKNEKYVGDLLGQKYYVDDPMTHKKKKNFGQKEQYYATDVHKGIVSRNLWNKCQEIYNQRSVKYAPYGKKNKEKYSRKYPFSSMIDCGFCDGKYIRKVGGKTGKGNNIKRVSYWRCGNIVNKKKECQAKESIRELYLKDIFIQIFNTIASHNKSNRNRLFKIIKETLNENNNKINYNTLLNEKWKYEERLSHLIDLKLDNYDNLKVYEQKEKEINEKLFEINSEIISLSKNNNKSNKIENQLLQIKKVLESSVMLEEFDDDIFKLIIKKIIIGAYDDSGTFNTNIIIFVLNLNEDNRIIVEKDKSKIKSMSYYDGE